MRKLLALGAAVALVSLPAPAYAISGNDLYTECRDGNEAFCTGFIWGAAHAFGVLPEDASLLCFPAGVSNGQMLEIVQKYLGGHPEIRHENAAGIVWMALSEAFSCV